MAKISTYPLDTDLIGTDYWIGSDANSNYATKNFTIDAVAEYMNRKATQSQLLRFKYTTTVPLTIGSLSFEPQGDANVLFSSIDGFRLSKSDLTEEGVDISSYYTQPLSNSDVLITQGDDISRWGVYTWNSSTVVPGNANYFDIDVTYKAGSNGLIAGKDYFISLLTYAGQNDLNKVMTLDGGSTTYVLNHNLNKYCAVSVVDDQVNPNEVYCEVVYNSANTITLTFGIAFTGQAFFN
tara:strand:+ start:800 stop:1513 length:714 start_codon:yes stop_codon:yes gene_type:complete